MPPLVPSPACRGGFSIRPSDCAALGRPWIAGLGFGAAGVVVWCVRAGVPSRLGFVGVPQVESMSIYRGLWMEGGIGIGAWNFINLDFPTILKMA